MSTNENARLQHEASATAYAMAALTVSTDGLTYSGAAAPWSNRSIYAPVVRPNGVLTGGAVTPSGTNNVVNIAALSLNLNGVVTAVAGGTLTATRGASTNTHSITSLTVNASGNLAALAGTASTAFSETRGGAGGPPFIPVDSVEIGQVRLTSTTAGLVTAAEIFVAPGSHVERADSPVYEVDFLNGTVTMNAAAPAIHTGNTRKKVFASYATPQYADVPLASAFTPPANAYSVTSTQVYGGTYGSSSKTLNAGGFTAALSDGITDPILAFEGEELWFKFFQDRAKSAHELCQGKLGITRAFDVANRPIATCVIAASAVGSRNA